MVLGSPFILIWEIRGPCPVIPGPHYSKERQNSGNEAACGCCPCQDHSIGMPTLHIGPVVSEKNGSKVKGFSFNARLEIPTQ